MKGVADVVLHMCIIPKPHVSGSDSIPRPGPIPDSNVSIPVCRYVNLSLTPGCNLKPGKNILSRLKHFFQSTKIMLPWFPAGFQATLLLENPVGANILTHDQLHREVRAFVSLIFFSIDFLNLGVQFTEGVSRWQHARVGRRRGQCRTGDIIV